MFSSHFLLIAYALTVVNALGIAFAGTSGTKKKGVFAFRHSRKRNLLHHVRGGAKIQKRKWQQLQTYKRTEELTVLDADADHEYTPNVFPKEEEDSLFIKEVLKANLMFHDLFTEKDRKNHGLSNIVTAFEKQVLDEGTLLYEQGDTENTDYLYLIGSGSCDVSIDSQILPDPYGTIGPGSLIGELALLYGTARAATVRTKSNVTVYRLQRSDFNYFMDCNHADSEESGKIDIESSSSINSRAEKVKQDVREIDRIIDRISGVKTKYDGAIIQQFKPSRMWLWTRWRGTIMQHAWGPAIANMSISIFFIIALRLLNNQVFKNPVTWPIGENCTSGIA